jgi:hypothetical protein
MQAAQEEMRLFVLGRCDNRFADMQYLQAPRHNLLCD